MLKQNKMSQKFPPKRTTSPSIKTFSLNCVSRSSVDDDEELVFRHDTGQPPSPVRTREWNSETLQGAILFVGLWFVGTTSSSPRRGGRGGIVSSLTPTHEVCTQYNFWRLIVTLSNSRNRKKVIGKTFFGSVIFMKRNTNFTYESTTVDETSSGQSIMYVVIMKWSLVWH